MSKMIYGSNDTYIYSFHSNKELVWSDLGRNGKLILYGALAICMEFQEKKSFFSKFQHLSCFENDLVLLLDSSP